ncbi:odorant receptor 4 isoform X2 [Diachasma alloeum]|uniref:odorant receptor 4 isoform X2 n=1 Tax=Diachasma alloeum TaxID=454923 RepID=UPI0007382FD9|nr:odorant receptor 4 isoform X2 [Diachasma alloeum]
MGGGVDFWDHPYYKTVKRFTAAVGLWPGQSMKEIIMCRFGIFIVSVVQIGPQIMAFWKHRNDRKMVMDTISPFIVDLVFTVKLVNVCCHFKKLRYLLEQIREHWTIFSRNNGIYMLHYHSDFGRKLSVLYLVGVYVGWLCYTTEPLQRIIFYRLLNPNITAPKRFSMPMDFGPVNLAIWYYPLLFGSGFCVFVILTVVGSCDLLLFLCAEHACGMFKALGYAIEHLPPYDAAEKGDYSFEYMRRCAAIHRRAIEDIFLWSFFGVIGLNMLIMSITAVQVVINLNAMEKVIQYTSFVSMQMVHLFVECFSAQRVMDASFELKETLTNAKWYDASRRTQKLIPLMLIRSQTPIVLTAGKIIVMNMNTYAVVLKTAASYFTVFLVMQ